MALVWSGYALLIFGGGMVFSENRQPLIGSKPEGMLFRIML